uniref:Putative VRR-NUC domain-containing protein n=1 Tax=viral metagenome TaxID=1070528 RepID=A0A6H1ZPD5_9ZZZZ
MPPVPKPVKKKRIANPTKTRIPKEFCPLEETEQITLASWLDWNHVLYCHVPNGGYRHPVTANRFKAQGVKAGVPDILIFDRPYPVEDGTHYVGIAIELKRKDKSLGRLSANQAHWISALRERGWLCNAFYGADAAIEYLKSLGYGVR